ncbi:transglutaminase domain-containing protein [Flammeovirga aprica]|uniref:Transglutaminase-like domain-containing protein n=1 Tax=Flammeovirga aprica JL-4 TaxID=694437 RepID=A0A7X9RSY5_9BACT|nr:transglutaminase domain-containing protein [Flammeovirga aprica]NME67800.1 hypothetical protein [Flammeovirga aprica JL-4]
MMNSRSIYTRLLLLTLLSLGCTTVFSQNNASSTVFVPRYAEQSLNELSKYLTSNENSDYQKAKNIYDWITNNFLLEERYKIKRYSIQQILKRRRGTAEEFSNLFDSLCHRSGLVSKQIVGYTFTENKPIIKVLYQPNHYWNAILIDKKWYQVDCLWGSNYGRLKKLTFDINGNSVNYELKKGKEAETYFCPAPQDLIKTHFPADPNWQLLENSITSKEFIQNDFSGVTNSKLRNEILDEYATLECSDYLYLSSKNAFVHNSKNHRQLAVSSLEKGKNLVFDVKATQKEKDLFFQKKQIYYHEASSSASSYSSNVSLYSKVEKEALVLWIRHNISGPIAKRTKYIDRFSFDKHNIVKKELQEKNLENNLKHFKDKVSKKNYASLKKPRRKSEQDPLYFKVNLQQIEEADSIIQELELKIANLKSINKILIDKKREQILVKKSLNYSQTSYLQQFKLLLQVDVTLQVLGHQSSQITRVDNSIDVLVKSIKSIDKDLVSNKLELSKNISELKKQMNTKLSLYRGLYIVSNAETAYKKEYDKVNESLKEVFENQIKAREEEYEALVWSNDAIIDENEELMRQKKIIRDIIKIKSDFRKKKIASIAKREIREKKFCEEITQTVYDDLNQIKIHKKEGVYN